MGKALYREHRPKRLADVVGQAHITRALEKALSNKQISHAYLFTGPRGVGKTSVARILAHEVNDLPYDENATHLDIIEIDAASNRRIDEIRDLREKVHITPTHATYKVYIIDEVHMLTKEAFNALLKTLEEPPAHVIFILATTELHKLPETIISRTQHFAFRPISHDKIVEHLKAIAKNEKIKIDDSALTLLAEHGEGSFRDSISMLDQIRTFGTSISVKDVEQMLGIAPEASVRELVKTIMRRDTAKTVTFLEQLHGQGIEAAILAKQLSAVLRTGMLAGTYEASISLPLLEKLLRVSASQHPKQTLELILLEVTFSNNQALEAPPTKPASTSKSAASVKAPVVKSPVAKKTQTEEQEFVASPPQTKTSKIDEEISQLTPSATLDEAVWPQVLAHIKQKYNTMYGVLRMAQPSFKTGELVLNFKFAFHQKRMNDPKNKKIIMDAIHAINNTNVKITCVVSEAASAAATGADAKNNKSPNDIATISNIFGGAELLES